MAGNASGVHRLAVEDPKLILIIILIIIIVITIIIITTTTFLATLLT